MSKSRIVKEVESDKQCAHSQSHYVTGSEASCKIESAIFLFVVDFGHNCYI